VHVAGSDSFCLAHAVRVKELVVPALLVVAVAVVTRLGGGVGLSVGAILIVL
jgi:hypothetical protein